MPWMTRPWRVATQQRQPSWKNWPLGSSSVSRRGAVGTKTQDDSRCAMVHLCRETTTLKPHKCTRQTNNTPELGAGPSSPSPPSSSSSSITILRLFGFGPWRSGDGVVPECMCMRRGATTKFNNTQRCHQIYTALTTVRTTTTIGGDDWDGCRFALRRRRGCCVGVQR